MFEQYFVKPATIDRLRGSWIGSVIETYLVWLDDSVLAPSSGRQS